MLPPNVDGLTSVHLASLDSPGCSTKALHGQLLRWTEIGSVSASGRECGTCTTLLTRSAGLWTVLLLFLSGNIHPTSGPELVELTNPDNLKNSGGLRFVHVNVRGLVSKIDAIRLCAKLPESDVILLSENLA